VPGLKPVTMPAVPIVATVVLPLLHTPPVVRSLNVVVAPGHTLSVPVMINGKGFTVTVARAVQPVAAAV